VKFPSLPAAALLFFAAAACSGPASTGAEDQKRERPSGVAATEGAVPMNSISLRFVEYRNDPKELAARVDGMLADAAAPARGDDPVALVVPHAGYVYSGPVAAYAYNAVRGRKYDTVVVLGLSHRVPYGGISLLVADSFDSPLGSIPFDRELTSALLEADDGIFPLPEAHSDEHSLEVQIPFLQRSLEGFSLVMAAISDPDAEAEAALVRVLVEAAKRKKVLLVASSDFSHYYPYSLANRMDSLALNSILALDPAALKQDVQQRKCELCGLRPVLAVMEAAGRLGVSRGVLLRQANSGDTAGPKDRVVGYAAIAFYADGKKEGEEKAPKEERGALDEASKRELLSIARGAIEGMVRNGRAPEPSTENGALMNPQGAFVTIKIGGKLRGCIGNFGIRNAKPLYQTVSEMAVAAAVQDPRFPPLSKKELPQIEIEISALSPLRPESDPEKIEVGRHGIYITKGHRSGVLLPQVATEYGWDRLTFLRQTCRKAGLGADEWKDGATISTFEAEVFGEREL
jgi:AmmeMemoRadiSam system protein B/AmmeMemoRadiSam system protein A